MSTRDIKFQKQNRRIPYISRLLRFWYCLYTQVISAIEIIEPAFPIVVIAAVAERILVADAGGNGIAVGIYNLEHFTPCVIEILNDQITVGIANLNDIALEVQDIVIQGTVIAHALRRTVLIVIEQHGVTEPRLRYYSVAVQHNIILEWVEEAFVCIVPSLRYKHFTTNH